MHNHIKWIFFDIGSTLVDETKCYEKRFAEAIYGTNISYEEFKNKVIAFSKQNLKGDHEAVKYYGLSLPKWHSELEMLYPQTENVLNSLKNRGYRLGIIANQAYGTKNRLQKWNILHYFDVIIASAEAGVSKPDLKIFQLALQSAKCAAQNCVMVGDRLDNDIAPAKEIGMRTVWIKQGFAKYSFPICEEEKADFIINSLTDIENLFINK